MGEFEKCECGHVKADHGMPPFDMGYGPCNGDVINPETQEDEQCPCRRFKPFKREMDEDTRKNNWLLDLVKTGMDKYHPSVIELEEGQEMGEVFENGEGTPISEYLANLSPLTEDPKDEIYCSSLKTHMTKAVSDGYLWVNDLSYNTYEGCTYVSKDQKTWIPWFNNLTRVHGGVVPLY